jgi:hypothetical protein
LLITEDLREIPATVCDVSTLGIRVETTEELPLGLTLRVAIHDFDASGIVRHCTLRDDKYEVGVHLSSARSEPATSESPATAELPRAIPP